jgi:uncharacterized protein YkwD
MVRALFLVWSAGLLTPALVSPQTVDPEVRLFIRLVNEYRESIGCEALVVDLRAQTVAQAHSEDMYERRYVAHVNPEGASFTDRLRRAGLSFSAAAENIAQTAEGGREVLDLWLASPPHRVNIQNCAFTRHGVGRFESRWTHVLFRE